MNAMAGEQQFLAQAGASATAADQPALAHEIGIAKRKG